MGSESETGFRYNLDSQISVPKADFFVSFLPESFLSFEVAERIQIKRQHQESLFNSSFLTAKAAEAEVGSHFDWSQSFSLYLVKHSKTSTQIEFWRDAEAKVYSWKQFRQAAAENMTGNDI